MSSLIDPERHGYTWHDVTYRLKSAFAVLLSLAVLIGGGWFVYDKAYSAWMDYRQSEDYIGDGDHDVIVLVPQGTTLYGVSDILVAADVVKTAKAFDKAAAANDKAKTLQAGKYRLKTKLPAKTALEMMLDPAHQIKVKVLIREGLTLKEELDVLSKPQSTNDKPGGTGFPLADFQAALKNPAALGLPAWANNKPEGFLFPDTYNFADATSATAVLQTMARRFNQVANQTNIVALSKNVKRSPYEVMIVASIIEAEVKRDADRPKVARVIYNRLDKGMKLRMDTTVKYVVGKNGSTDTTAAERATQSPYNTYLNNGLPPGPISTPGQKSIVAALNPEPGDWLFFTVIDTETGETAFASDEAGHAENVKKYQEFCASHPGKC